MFTGELRKKYVRPTQCQGAQILSQTAETLIRDLEVECLQAKKGYQHARETKRIFKIGEILEKRFAMQDMTMTPQQSNNEQLRSVSIPVVSEKGLMIA